ncbi:MAG: aminopeptidase P family protein [Oscillospiraceae bacterium]|nr:aminopeptidase P family protein [Oscillospiraceae bacterium]
MNNIARIQEKLIEKGLDAILITDEKNQRYATGFPFTDGSVLVSREKAWLFTDSRYIEAAEAAASCCCSVQLFDKSVSQLELIKAALKEANVEKLGGEQEKLNYAGYIQFEKDLGLALQPAQALLSELRALKTQEEVDSIVKAQRISEKALEEVLKIIKPGMTEREVAAELVYHMLKNGSEGNSFDPIVVTGSKTSLPHGVPGDKVICAGDFITMDFGSLHNGYCSDMTRTVAVGQASDEMKNVYDTVLKAQLAGIAAAKAGVPGCEIDGAARKVIEDAGFGPYFGHGLGHSLGLDIHEAPNANPRNTEPMPAGAVITIEPGIYLPGRFGVRIEDMVAVEEGGCTVLTKAPKELIIL